MRDFSHFDLLRLSESYRSIGDGEGDGSASGMDFTDEAFIRSAFNPPQGDRTRTVLIPPNVNLMRTAYSIFNREFFNGELPPDLPLEVTTDMKNSYHGFASYQYNLLSRTVEPTGIKLNSRFAKSLHDWLNTMLHECIHILEYVERPYVYLNSIDRRGICRYDSHGPWFMSVARRFDQFGFDVKKYCTTDIRAFNSEDEGVAKSIKRNRDGMLLARIVGLAMEHGGGLVKISRTFKPKFESFIEGCIAGGRNFCKKLTKVEYYTSDNPGLLAMKQFRPRNSSSTISWYYFDNSERKYGPFKLEGEFVPRVLASDSVPAIVTLMGSDTTFKEGVKKSILGGVLLMSSRMSLLEDYVDMSMWGCDGWKQVFSEDSMREIAEDSGLRLDDDVKEIVYQSLYVATDGYDNVTNVTVLNGLEKAAKEVSREHPSEWYAAEGYVREWVDGVMKQYGKQSGEVNEDADEVDADERNLIDDKYARGGWIPFRNTRTKVTGPSTGIVDVA